MTGCCSNVSSIFSRTLHFTPLPPRPARFGISSSIIVSDKLTISTQKCRRPSGLRCNSQLTTDLAPLTSAAYGTLLLGGGLFAYARSGSKGSLIGGLTGGTLMGTAYFLMQASETQELGDALAFGSALLFSSVFAIRLVASRKVVPAAPLLGVSVGALTVFVLAYLRNKI